MQSTVSNSWRENREIKQDSVHVLKEHCLVPETDVLIEHGKCKSKYNPVL